MSAIPRSPPSAPRRPSPGSRHLRLAGQRLYSVLLTLLGLLALTFSIGRVMPLDPVLSIVGPDADRSTYQRVYHQLGLGRPVVAQFGYDLRDLLHGDSGNGPLTGHPDCSL